MSDRTDTAALLARALERIRRAKAEVAEARRPPSARCPIAIVGMACRAPGADDVDALWANLMDGRDAVGPIPPERWDVDAHYDPTGEHPNKMYVRTGGFLRDIAAFDPQFFHISPREAVSLDPQQRLTLQVAWHALEHAAIPPARLRGTRTGVFFGICTNEYGRLLETQGARISAFSGTSNALSVVSGRIAYTLGLEGPAVSYDTACSSSLVALHQAVRALQDGDCDAALAGGVNTVLSPRTMVSMCRLNMLSPRGRCASFDAEGDGFARAEGCGVVVLERLVDARRAGRRVLAVIRGSAINQDGRSAGITAPSRRAQVEVIRAALADGELQPDAVTYIESHGTGTALGDPIEMGALGDALCGARDPDRPLLVGSIKSNIGHAESASGILGLIKAVLAIRHGVVPRNLHFETPNPHIPWDALPVTVPTAPTPWTPGLAGVNSFGFSGTNAHVIVGPPDPADAPGAARPRAVEILPVSAAEPEALDRLLVRYADRLAAEPSLWPHLAASAGRGRQPLRCRATVRAADAAAAQAGLRALAERRVASGAERDDQREGRAPRVGFLFSGQGAQYGGMGRALMAEEPVFAATIDRCAAVLDGVLPLPLRTLLTAPDAPIHETRFTQPALFALQVALAALWRSVGVEPVAVLGHSVGAYAAAVVAGIMSLEDGAALVAERARLMGALPAGGAMATVEASARRVLVAARDAQVEIAAINGPASTVIAGDADAVDAAVAAFEARGIRARRLTVSHAFHSARMDPVVDRLRARAAECEMRPPTLCYVDDRTATVVRRAPTADNWARHAREPVRFADALGTLVGEGCDALVELGPRPTALAMARMTLGDACPVALASIRPGRPAFADALAALWRLGAPVDWDAHWVDRGARQVPLPAYPFAETRYWVAEEGGAADAPEPAERNAFEVRWRPLPAVDRRSLAGPWLVIGGEDDIGSAVLDALHAAGAAAEGLHGDDPSAVAARVVDGHGGVPWHGVLDLTALRAPALADVAPDALAGALEDARRATCDGVLAALDALSRLRGEAPRLCLVTRRAVSVGGEPPDVAQALRRGLGRVLITEHRAFAGGLIDVDAGPPEAMARALVEVLAGGSPPEVALRGAGRFVPRLVPHRRDPRSTPVALDAPGTILITGGLGGLGLALTERLITRGARYVALMSRSAPSAEVEARIAGWAERGARVYAVAGDVARPEDVRRALAVIDERGPPLVGVVHAAGVLDDGLLLDLSPARFDRVLAPKVAGALLLAAAVEPSVFMVFFSSIAGLLGTPGQGNYAAANAALDALAADLAARGRRAISIQWGPWAEVGMAARLEARRGRAAGMAALAPADALNAFERLLAHRGAAVAVMALPSDVGPWEMPIFAELRPPDGSPGGEEHRPATPPGRLWSTLEALADEARPAAMLTALLGHIGAVLDLDPARIDPERPAVDLGMDSLLVMEMLDRVKHDLDMPVYPREVYQQPSVRAMADYLLAEAAAHAGQAGDRSGAVGAPAPGLIALQAELDPAVAPPEPLHGVGFVLSTPRSGSTLLRVMLQGHRALFAPPELWLLSANDMAQRATHLGPMTIDQGYTLALRGALGCSTEETEARVAEMVEARLPTWAAYAALTAQLDGRTLIDKTPTYAMHPPTLARLGAWFAPGPVVHLVRHPLSVVDSIVRTRLDRLAGHIGLDSWSAGEGMWLAAQANLQDFEARHADRPVHRVRFEDLVTRPRETMEALCAALGLSFEPAMLEPYTGDRMTGGLRSASAPIGDQNFARHQGIDPRLADAWRAVEPPRPLTEPTRAMAAELGYELPARGDRVVVPAAPSKGSDSAAPATVASAARPLRIELDRLRIGGLVWGPADGPLVLAVHGVLDHAGVWAPVAERLAGRGLRVVAPDLRGHGASDHVGRESGYAPLDFVHDLAAVVDGLGATPAAVVGHSLGAATAALHAVAAGGSWPLVLIEPPLPGRSGLSAAGLGRWLAGRTEPADHPRLAALDAAVERLQGSMSGVPVEALEAFAARAVRAVDGGFVWRWDARLRARADLLANGASSEQWLALLEELAPRATLVFADDSDFVRPADRARQAAVVDPGRVVRLAGGHHLPLSAPDATVDAILDALGATVT